MTRTPTDQAYRLFTESALADESLGYPKRFAFVAVDNPHRDAIVRRNLSEHLPTVLVDEDAVEVLLVPIARRPPLRWWDRRRGRIPVSISWRQHRGPTWPRCRPTLSGYWPRAGG